MATGTLAPSPWLTVENASGIPYVGARVYTYLAGTTTPVATYTDAGLTVANANPIITDAAGRYVAYLSPGASYKFVVQDANGVAIKTVDNITAVPASSANLDITGTAGEALTAGQAVYLSDGSGSKTAGQWYKADPANAYSSSAAVAVGMVPASISAAASGTIRLAGQMTGLSALTLGTTYYVTTAGALTSTQPTNARVMGIADTTSTLILGANPGTPNQDNGINDFRLTLTTGVPVTSTDVTAATTIYCTPITGNRIGLADTAGNVTVRTSAEFSIAVPATTATVYDVFAYSNAGVPTLELLAWTNPTTRATGIVLTTTGFYTKSGDLTRRYLASVRTTAVSGQTEDSATKRFVWNYYHRVPRALLKIDGTASWGYSIATWRQANGAATNQVETVVGVAEVTLDLMVIVAVSNDLAGGGMNTAIGIGQGSTTTPMSNAVGGGTHHLTANQKANALARVRVMPAVGYQFWAWIEDAQALGVTTWYGDAGAFLTDNAGLIGTIEG